MRDKISIPRVQLLHPAISAQVMGLIVEAETKIDPNCAIRIVQGLRTIDEQNALYAKGRTADGKIVTNAKGGSSYHNYGLAIDFAILIDKDGNGTYDEMSWDIRKDADKDGIADWLEVVKVFEAAEWEWGGRWSSIKDYPHLQKTFGFKWQELASRYNAKMFLPGTKYVQLS